MTQPLTIAYSELTRVLPWSLRALGYKFGTADRGAHLVATAAAIDPTALDAIATARPRPERGPVLRLTSEGLAIDAHDISFLEVGPVAVDYLAAHSDGSSHKTCTITGATETALLPAIVAGAEAYGLGCIAIIAGNGWLLGYPEEQGSALVAGEDLNSLSVLFDDREGGHLADARNDAPGTVRLLVSKGPHLTASPADAVSPAKATRLAQRRGIAVSQATLDAIYGLEMLTWAPTSERSRSQAGFMMTAGTQQ